MQSLTPLSLINDFVSRSPVAKGRPLKAPRSSEYMIHILFLKKFANPNKADAFKTRTTQVEFNPGGKVYEAMLMCRTKRGADPRLSQPSRIDIEGLPWPLSVPWPGSFLTSGNAARDFNAHAVFADMEKETVKGYREQMISSHIDIGDLRNEIVNLLGKYYAKEDPQAVGWYFADSISLPAYNSDTSFEDREDTLLNDALNQSYSEYNSQVQEIIKFCARQPVMLAHPSGDKDNAFVRKAFQDFITVSSSLCLSDFKLANF